MACEDIMHTSTAHAIGCAIVGDPNIVDFLIYKGCDIVSARTWLVKEAIKLEATHICFIDSDMMFPPEAIKKLLAHGKEIISVEYNKREFPVKKVTQALDKASETEIYKGKVLGMGLMLIDLAIFTNKENPLGAPTETNPRPTPWFNFGRDSEGALVLGEDAWFCNVARDAGYDCWIDPTIKVRHIGEYAY